MPELPGIDLTNSSDSLIVKRLKAARLSGAQGYLVKPVPNVVLLAEVEQLLAELKADNQ